MSLRSDPNKKKQPSQQRTISQDINLDELEEQDIDSIIRCTLETKPVLFQVSYEHV